MPPLPESELTVYIVLSHRMWWKLCCVTSVLRTYEVWQLPCLCCWGPEPQCEKSSLTCWKKRQSGRVLRCLHWIPASNAHICASGHLGSSSNPRITQSVPGRTQLSHPCWALPQSWIHKIMNKLNACYFKTLYLEHFVTQTKKSRNIPHSYNLPFLLFCAHISFSPWIF